MSELANAYEDLTAFKLDAGQVDALCAAQNECVFSWSTKDGWPVGVIMSYVREPDGRIWLTCARHRKRVAAVQRDDRVSIVITSTGSSLGRGQTVTFKGRCTVHAPEDDGFADLKAWFYPRLVDAIFNRGVDETFKRAFTTFLDSPERVILEVTTSKEITYDGPKMGAATAAAIAAGTV